VVGKVAYGWGRKPAIEERKPRSGEEINKEEFEYRIDRRMYERREGEAGVGKQER